MKRIIIITTLLLCGALFCSCEKAPGSGRDIPVPDNAIDLGVVITRDDGTSYKLYWSDCNLGARTPTESGDYFAWGESTTKKKYTWETYKWSSGEKPTKYCLLNFKDFWGGNGNPDGKIVLDPVDDAAHVLLGGKWRMPTIDEWIALERQCKISVGVQQESVVGILIEGNRKSIFLPFTGIIDKNGLQHLAGDNDGYGKLCVYSSSSSKVPTSSAMVAFYWQSRSYPDGVSNGMSLRYIGHPIRPVWEESIILE